MSHDRSPGRPTGRPCLLYVAAVAAVATAVTACGNPPSVSSTATAVGRPGPGATASPTVDAQLLAVLQRSWAGYKQGFIRADGRVSDPTRGGITNAVSATGEKHSA